MSGRSYLASRNSPPQRCRSRRRRRRASTDNLYTTCLKGTACLLLITDGSDTGADVLDDLTSKYKHDKFNFAQVDGSVQSDFADQLSSAPLLLA